MSPAAAQTIAFTPTSLPPGTVGTPYSQAVLANDSDGAEDVNGPFDADDVFTYTVTAGALPPGLTLNFFNGTINGTPTTGGTYPFTVTATDQSSPANTGNQAYTVLIGTNALTIAPSNLPSATQGTQYNQTVTASGGAGAPYTYSVSAGSLPAGLSINPSTGAITGIPTGSGSSNFTIQANDNSGNFGTQAYTVNVGTTSLTVNPPALPNGTQGVAYSQTIIATGGTGGPYTYSVTSGALPAGLSIDLSSGAITGTPTTLGQSIFTVQALDGSGNSGSRGYAVNIGSGSGLTVTPPTLPNGSNGTPYSQTIGATGGSGPYTFALTVGSLPAGLTLNPNTGAITGTPSGSGASSFTIRATDSVGNAGTQAYSVNIGGSSLTVTPPTLPVGTQNVPYNHSVGATGGTGGPYTFTISGGSLPAGLTMSSGGVISGTPTGAGSSFTVRALDAQGNFGTRLYALGIGTASLTVNPATLPAPVTGRSYSQTLTGSGGTAPYTFSISGGALPPGLTLNGVTGVISGTPTGAGAANFTVQVLDVNGNIGTRTYNLTSRPDPALDPEVQGLVLAQVAAAQRYASTQVSNITRHLETLHENFTPCGFNFNIAVPISGAAPQQFGAPYNPGYADPNALYSPNGQYGAPPQGYGPHGYAPSPAKKPAGPFNSAADPVTTSADPSFAPQPQYQQPYQPQYAPKRLPPCSSDWMTSMAFWTSGSFQFGSVTPSGAPSGNRFNTTGLTAGIDIRPSDSLIVGIAVGYGGDRTDVGLNGSRSDSTSLSAALYACMRLTSPFFLDAAIGYGSLGYDNRRFVTADATFADGSRKGSYWYGAVKLSAELVRGNVKIAPYISGDFTSVSLGSYSEQGPSAQLLSYNDMNFNALSGAVGLRGSIDLPMSFGILTPNARVEYKQTSQSAFDQSMYYTDLGAGSSSTFGQPVGARGVITGAVGLRARSAGGLGVEIEYAVSTGTDSYQSQSIRGAMRVPF